MLKEDKRTNIAYENSSAGTANTFIKSVRHRSMKTVAVIGFPAAKKETITYILSHPLFQLLGWGTSLLPHGAGSTIASLHPKLNC